MKLLSINSVLHALAVGAAIAVGNAPQVHAQKAVGTWNLYPQFDSNVVNVLNTGNKVYYVSAKRLYSYDTATGESYAYTTSNRLNDTDVRNIYYDDERRCLLVAYETANIDLIYVDTDRVVNMADIANANLTYQKVINDVHFSNGRIYVATSFGLVIFDAAKHVVLESGIYNHNITAVCVAQDRIVMSSKTDIALFHAPVNGRHNTLDRFTRMTCYFTASWCAPLGNNRIVYRQEYDGQLRSIRVEFDINDYFDPIVSQNVTLTQNPVRNADGSYTGLTAASIASVAPDGTVTTRALPADLQKQKLAPVAGTDKLWGVDARGLAQYSLDNAGTVTVLADKARPESLTCNEVAYLAPSKDGSRIYASAASVTFRPMLGANTAGGNGTQIMQRTDVLVNGVPQDAAVFETELYKTKTYQTRDGNKRMYGGCKNLAVDPQNPNRYYIANFLEGVFVIEDNKEVGRFSVQNMPCIPSWGDATKGAYGEDVNFDPEGNLWLGNFASGAKGSISPYIVLPAEKLRGDLTQIKKEDWVQSKHKTLNYEGSRDMRSLFTSRGKMLLNWAANDQSSFFVTDTRGTYANTEDDIIMEFSDFTDQDGNRFKPVKWWCAAEDKRGRVWVGTSSGVIEITDPARLMDANFRINRLKVPRNDGTNYADYLLDAEAVHGIAVDAANRKWIATENSGIYLVSENGDKILEHFTTENSPLPTNCISTVYCDPNSSTVYFGMPTGLISYNSKAAPAAETYDNVYAYPNPVRPDYTGWITVKGLKENSLVKITDMAGNLIYQTRSEGGMMVWDGCNADGQRVRTGVYLVFASQTDGDNTSGAVTKITVIN